MSRGTAFQGPRLHHPQPHLPRRRGPWPSPSSQQNDGYLRANSSLDLLLFPGIWAPTLPSNSPRPLRGHRTDTLAPRRGVLLLTNPDPAHTPAPGALCPRRKGLSSPQPSRSLQWLGTLYVPEHLDCSPGPTTLFPPFPPTAIRPPPINHSLGHPHFLPIVTNATTVPGPLIHRHTSRHAHTNTHPHLLLYRDQEQKSFVNSEPYFLLLPIP